MLTQGVDFTRCLLILEGPVCVSIVSPVEKAQPEPGWHSVWELQHQHAIGPSVDMERTRANDALSVSSDQQRRQWVHRYQFLYLFTWLWPECHCWSVSSWHTRDEGMVWSISIILHSWRRHRSVLKTEYKISKMYHTSQVRQISMHWKHPKRCQ